MEKCLGFLLMLGSQASVFKSSSSLGIDTYKVCVAICFCYWGCGKHAWQVRYGLRMSAFRAWAPVCKDLTVLPALQIVKDLMMEEVEEAWCEYMRSECICDDGVSNVGTIRRGASWASDGDVANLEDLND